MAGTRSWSAAAADRQAADPAPTGKVRVRVADGWAVFVKSKAEQVSGGNTVEVDADTAAYWLDRGWAEAAPAAPAKPATAVKRSRKP